MPTAEEFRLFDRMDGGTGDMAQDEHIARHLSRIIAVPEQEIASFVRTRDRDTVHKLRDVLKDMPRGKDMQIGGPRASLRPSGPNLARINSTETRGKLKEMSSAWRTNYTWQCDQTPTGTDAPPGIRTHPFVFDGLVRSSFKPHFDRWASQANESKVKVIADACRSMRNFNKPPEPPTCYKEMFPKYPAQFCQPPPDRNNKKNLSCVPLGMIYAASSIEKECLARRDQLFRDELAAARKREADVLDGTALRPDKRMAFSTVTFVPPDQSTAADCFKGDCAPSNEWKGEIKSVHNDAVHSKRQGLKFGVIHVKRGVTKLALEGCAGDHRRRPGLSKLSQSAPSLSKTA